MSIMTVDIAPRQLGDPVYVSQGDIGRVIEIHMYDGDDPYSPPSGLVPYIQGLKPSGLGFNVRGTVSGNVCTFETTAEMTDEKGDMIAEVRLIGSSVDIGTANFRYNVEERPRPDGTTDGTIVVITDVIADALQAALDDIDTAKAAAIAQLATAGGVIARTASQMTEPDQVYIYVGSESGYSTGYWYYNNGTNWVPGGQYGGAITDSTLTDPAAAANSKAVGDALALKADSSDVTALEGDVDNLGDALATAVTITTVDRKEEETFNRSVLTAGIMSENGTVTSSTSAGYTPPFDVEPGEIITAERYYLNSRNEITGRESVNMRAGAFRASEQASYTNVGFTIARESYTVPDGIHSAQITISGIMTGTYTYVVITRTTPNGLTTYALVSDITDVTENKKILNFISGNLSTKDFENQYGCALPITPFRMTVGIAEKWYKKSMATPPTDFVAVTGGYSTTKQENDGALFANASAYTSVNGYIWKHYDNLLNLISEYTGSAGIGGSRKVIAENLSDCTLLAIGDSTVDHDKITGKLLSYFTEKGHTITLLGTLGSNSDPLNRNEGRAGWTSAEYLANTVKNGYTNPFYNPSTQTFDFSYYMTQQSYSGVDFVVIQLGINDLYGSTTFSNPSITDVWNNIKVMIDSIFAYNSSIKVILNLPTTPNADQSKHPVIEFLYRNRVVRYNGYAIAQAQVVYGDSKVRPSYCHLLLDPDTEIRDNVHPTDAGYEKMAMEIVNQINVWQNGY